MSNIESDRTAINNSIKNLQHQRRIARRELSSVTDTAIGLKKEIEGYAAAIKWRQKKLEEM